MSRQTSPEKIKDHETWSIATVWGIGYKFEVKDEKTLIPKLIFGYVLFVALGFIILCTFTQHAITHYAENREAQQLYRESVQIASGYADNYNKYSFRCRIFKNRCKVLANIFLPKSGSWTIREILFF